MSIQNHELSYSEILAKSDRTTQLLSILGGAIVLLLITIFSVESQTEEPFQAMPQQIAN